eukprot:gene11914-biopygen4892
MKKAAAAHRSISAEHSELGTATSLVWACDIQRCNIQQGARFVRVSCPVHVQSPLLSASSRHCLYALCQLSITPAGAHAPGLNCRAPRRRSGLLAEAREGTGGRRIRRHMSQFPGFGTFGNCPDRPGRVRKSRPQGSVIPLSAGKLLESSSLGDMKRSCRDLYGVGRPARSPRSLGPPGAVGYGILRAPRALRSPRALSSLSSLSSGRAQRTQRPRPWAWSPCPRLGSTEVRQSELKVNPSFHTQRPPARRAAPRSAAPWRP